jgi:hypothetical protein
LIGDSAGLAPRDKPLLQFKRAAVLHTARYLPLALKH